MSNVTQILTALDQGQARADELLPLVYEELRKLAAARMAQESPGQTLQPTALVHEAWLRLVGDANPKFDGRAHFFGAAAEAMAAFSSRTPGADAPCATAAARRAWTFGTCR